MKLLKRMIRTATVLGAVGVSLTLGVGDSHAGLGLQIDYGNNGSFETTILDGGAGDLAAGTTGLISQFAILVGNVAVLTNAGTSKDITGSATTPIIDLATLLVTSGATSIKIQLSDTGFIGDSFGFGQLVSIGGTITGSNGTVTTNVYRDLGNTIFGTGAGTLICSTGPMAADAFDAFAGGCGALVGLDLEYSVTLETIISLDGAGIVSYDAITRLARDGELDIPEPASMMLLGFGVLGIGAWRRRRRAQQD